MIGGNNQFAWPPRAQKLWRYMDPSKFLSLLQSKSLWFSRADCLGDPLEGSVPRARYDAEETYRAANDRQLSEWRLNMLRTAFVSCWHANESESAAMWDLYAKSDEAICVQTTFERISSALPTTFVGGMVRYIDYARDDLPTLNLFQPLMHKRRSYAHEQEFRLIGWTLSVDDGGEKLRELARPTGLSWPINPSQLIERVYVSPTAPGWFYDVVQRTVSDYELTASVHQSDLVASALY